MLGKEQEICKYPCVSLSALGLLQGAQANMGSPLNTGDEISTKLRNPKQIPREQKKENG